MHALSPYLTGILMAYAAFFVSIASPGPNILAVLGTSLSAGRRAGVSLALGIAAGSFIWAVLTASGLIAILASFASLLTVIKIVGGCYLLWLAFKAFRAAAAPAEIQTRAVEDRGMGAAGYFVRGLTVQLSNPKAALAWIAVISLGLSPAAPGWVALAIVGGTAVLSLVIHLLYALAFSTTIALRVYQKASRAIQGALGLFFAAAGVTLLISRA